MILTCKSCKINCTLKIEDNVITGNRCPRGITYAKNYLKDGDMSYYFTFVKLNNGALSKLPIKSSRKISDKEKERLLQELKEISVDAPVKAGEIVLKNVSNLGVDFISQRRIK